MAHSRTESAKSPLPERKKIWLRTASHSVQKYLKFSIVGASNAVVDIFILNLALTIHPTRSATTLLWYNTIAVTAAIINSFIWNRHWTFREESRGGFWEAGAFVAQAIVNIGLNDLIMVLLSDYLMENRNAGIYLGSNGAKVVAMLVSSTASFILMKIFVFRRPSVR